MNLIAVVENSKSAEKGDAQKLQAGLLKLFKEDHKKNMVYSIQNNPPSMYQKTAYTSLFFGFDKKQYP